MPKPEIRDGVDGTPANRFAGTHSSKMLLGHRRKAGQSNVT